MCVCIKLHDKHEAVTIEIYTSIYAKALLAPSIFSHAKCPEFETPPSTPFSRSTFVLLRPGRRLPNVLDAQRVCYVKCLRRNAQNNNHHLRNCDGNLQRAILTQVCPLGPPDATPRVWKVDQGSCCMFRLQLLFLVMILSCMTMHIWHHFWKNVFKQKWTQHDPTGHNRTQHLGSSSIPFAQIQQFWPPDVRDGITIQDQLLVIRMCPSTYNI